MLDENEVRLCGHICREPEVGHTNSGIAVANVVVATNRRWKDKTGKLCEEATFHDVVVLGPQATFIQSRQLRTGTRVQIKGSLRKRSWEKDGQKRYKVEVLAAQFSVVPSESRTQADGYHPEE